MALLSFGCGRNPPTPPAGVRGLDPDQVRAADISILFVGNSHTSMHNLPGLIRDLIRFRHPDKTVYTHHVSVAFLEDLAHSPDYSEQVAPLPWTHVVLQAQKISMSGKHDYSRTEGIEAARSAKSRGATVVFYPEWGLAGVAGDGARQEKVYREMAREAGVGVAPVARAWDLALAERPDLPLHSPDGNHQSELGAFLTACVLSSQLTGESTAGLAAYPYPAADAPTREFLAAIAAKALSQKE